MVEANAHLGTGRLTYSMNENSDWHDYCGVLVDVEMIVRPKIS